LRRIRVAVIPRFFSIPTGNRRITSLRRQHIDWRGRGSFSERAGGRESSACRGRRRRRRRRRCQFDRCSTFARGTFSSFAVIAGLASFDAPRGGAEPGPAAVSSIRTGRSEHCLSTADKGEFLRFDVGLLSFRSSPSLSDELHSHTRINYCGKNTNQDSSVKRQ